MQHIKKKASFFLTVALIASGILSSCENDPLTIGVETLPESDLLDAGVKFHTIFGDNIVPERIRTDGHAPGGYDNAAGILGYFNDPIFGFTKADVITEVTYSSQMDSFYMLIGDVFVDSVKLNIAYRYLNWYGDIETPLTIQVYELSDTLAPTPFQVYYNNEDMEGRFFPEPIGEATFTIKDNLTDSVWQQQNYVHQISIKLSDELANRLINLTATEMENRSAFKEVLNGLYISFKQPDDPTSTGSLMKFDIWNEKTNVEMFYRHVIYDAESNDEVLQTDLKNYIFPITTESRFFNLFQHEFNESVVTNDTNSEYLYIQGMAGVYPKIDLSEMIKLWSDSLNIDFQREFNYSISGVDFYFTPDTILMNSWEDLYMPMNQRLSLVTKDDEGRFRSLQFQNKNGQTREAFSRSVADYNRVDNHFRFRMDPDFFMAVAKGEIELQPLYLTISARQFNFRRTVLHNNIDNEQIAPKMKVRYIKYK